MHDLEHISWVCSVLYRSCTKCHITASQDLDYQHVDDIFVDDLSGRCNKTAWKRELEISRKIRIYMYAKRELQ